ncbi:snRNA-activating protein complex subunit 3-like [Tachysurus fulvidraco]|uniref:snRNA-activating protein complex subunit 3-like n=1 Tax=Tachysurus fulvidraco TaxID=1234273 RepID=UPI001FF03610|nr:snRNA-activating protein complex subunit 3-like [Tachysurus fulvidraco]
MCDMCKEADQAQVYDVCDAPGRDVNMAEGGSTKAMNENVPVFEHVEVNTKPFHIGSFRDLWLSVLKPEDYGFNQTAGEVEDAEFIETMGITPDILQELKTICSPESLRCHPADEVPDPDDIPADTQLATLKLRKKRLDYKKSLSRDSVGRHDAYANELVSVIIIKKNIRNKSHAPELKCRSQS